MFSEDKRSMKVYDVLLEYPNGATELIKTEVPLEVAKDAMNKVAADLSKCSDSDDYTVYYTETKNTLRKGLRSVK